MKLLLKILFFLLAIFCTNISEAKIFVLDDRISETVFSNAFNSENSKVVLQRELSGSDFTNTCKSERDLVDYRNLAISSKADAAKGGLSPLGLGSTAKVGVSRVNPVNITEELALKEIMGNPSMGNIVKLKKGMTDSRWHQNDGWQKMTWNNGGVEIHYVGQWQNGVLKAVDDFKIIGK